MTYRKPQLTGYSAISVIQGTQKAQGGLEHDSTVLRTTPAYEADE